MSVKAEVGITTVHALLRRATSGTVGGGRETDVESDSDRSLMHLRMASRRLSSTPTELPYR